MKYFEKQAMPGKIFYPIPGASAGAILSSLTMNKEDSRNKKIGKFLAGAAIGGAGGALLRKPLVRPADKIRDKFESAAYVNKLNKRYSNVPDGPGVDEVFTKVKDDRYSKIIKDFRDMAAKLNYLNKELDSKFKETLGNI